MEIQISVLDKEIYMSTQIHTKPEFECIIRVIIIIMI